MKWIMEKKNGKTFSLPAKSMDSKQIKTAMSPLALKILNVLSKKPSYPKEISKILKVHEQKVYYHIRNLEKADIIGINNTTFVRGALTKIYKLINPALLLLLKPLEETNTIIEENNKILEPFIESGKMNSLIVIGSPEPHGPTSARAKDISDAVNFALFLGTHLNYTPTPSIRLDTNIRKSDLKKNLILIGGPGVNSITKNVNSKLPIKFQKIQFNKNFYSAIYSTLTDKAYSNSNCGMIVKTKNPFDKTKSILVIAGKRAAGTSAAILSFLNNFDEISKGNKKKKSIFAKVVEGIDSDSDGIIDEVKILE